MKTHRKTAAFLLALLISASAALPSAAVVSADNENDFAIVSPDGEIADSTEPAAELKTSGDFQYSVTSLGDACIEGWLGSGDKIDVPETIDGITVTKIGMYAFDNSEAVTINIPKTITYISAENPFITSYKLMDITVSEGNETYYSMDGILCQHTDAGEEITAYPLGRKDTSFTVPDGFTSIGTAAVYSTVLESITLPSSLIEIKHHGLAYNQSLEKIDMSGTAITDIGDMAFANCVSLSEVRFSESLQVIGGGAFASCPLIKEIELPLGLLGIGQNAFAATGLMRVNIPKSVQSIGYCAFGYDESLQPVENFIIIGEKDSAAQTYASDTDEDYGYANNFTFVTPEDAENMEEYETLEQKQSGDFIYAEKDGEAYLIGYTAAMPTIEVPSEIEGLPVTRLCEACFYNSEASQIILPDTLKYINQFAFLRCTQLESIVIPDGVVEIGESAFDSCTALTEITIAGTCEKIADEAFLGCSMLEKISVSDAEGGNYAAKDGILYSKDMKTLVLYPAASDRKKFTVPKGTENIGISAFYGAMFLEEIDLSNVKMIDDYAFEQCSELKKVKLAKDMESVGYCAFYDCHELKSIRTYKINNIGKLAFGYFYDESAESNDVENSHEEDLLNMPEDEEESSNPEEGKIEGFRIYADKNSDGWQYAQVCGIECVTGTIEFAGKNIDLKLIYGIGGLAGALLLAVIGVFIGRGVKSRRAEKAADKLRSDAAEKLAEMKKEETTEDNTENEDK